MKDINDTKVLISLNEDFRPHPLERMVKAPSNTIMFIWKRWSITTHLKGLNVLCNRDKGIKTNHCREVLLTHQLNIMQLEMFQAPQERADRCFHLRGYACAGQHLRLHSVQPVTFTHSKLYFHSVVWIIVKEKTTVDHKLCIGPSAIKNVNLRCSEEKIKGHKRNLTSILNTKQDNGSVLIYLMWQHSSEVTTHLLWISCVARVKFQQGVRFPQLPKLSEMVRKTITSAAHRGLPGA